MLKLQKWEELKQRKLSQQKIEESKMWAEKESLKEDGKEKQEEKET